MQTMHCGFSVTDSPREYFQTLRGGGWQINGLLEMITTGKYLGTNSVFCEATTHNYSFFSDSMFRDLQTNHSKFTPSLHDYSGGT